MQGDHLFGGKEMVDQAGCVFAIKGDLARLQPAVFTCHQGFNGALAVLLFERVGSVEDCDLALVDECHPVGQLVRFEHVVRGEDNRRAALALFQDDVADGFRLYRVKAISGFVQEEQPGSVYQGARYHQALFYAF